MKTLLGPYRGLLFLVTALFLLGFSSPAFADEAPTPKIYVVDVLGEPLVAEHLRAAIGRELSVTAVAPDDPRAATAAAHLDIDARGADKTLRVTFRRTESPVTRVVALPDDAGRAETEAVFLAGNLARDEASDLLQGLAKPATTGDAAKAAAARERAENDRLDLQDLERMRALLHDGAIQGRSTRIYAGAARIGLGAALLVPGAIAYQNSSDAAPRRDLGVAMIVVGAALTVTGTLVLAGSNPEEAAYDDFTSIEHDGQEPSAILHRTERAWKARAEATRARRLFDGWFEVGLSFSSLTLGTVYALGGTTYSPTLGGLLLASGGVGLISGIHSLATESGIERSYRAWETFRGDRLADKPAPAVKPTLGFAPLRGGAYISGGFTF